MEFSVGITSHELLCTGYKTFSELVPFPVRQDQTITSKRNMIILNDTFREKQYTNQVVDS